MICGVLKLSYFSIGRTYPPFLFVARHFWD